MAQDQKLLTINPQILQQAREFRHPLTPAEEKVWSGVRNRRRGYKIRRQHPIDRFIADFYCNEAKLLIEIDGDTHSAPDQVEYDAARTRWLEDRGYQVIRFTNQMVYQQIEAVLTSIRKACETYSPLPLGEGEILLGSKE